MCWCYDSGRRTRTAPADAVTQAREGRDGRVDVVGNDEKPKRGGGDDVGEAGVAEAAAPVLGGEFSEEVAGTERAHDARVDEHLDGAVEDHVEVAIGVPATHDVLAGCGALLAAGAGEELQRCVVDVGEDVEPAELCWIGMGIPTPTDGRRRRTLEDRVRPDLVVDRAGRGHGDVAGLQPREDVEHVAGTGRVVQHAEADRVATVQPRG